MTLAMIIVAIGLLNVSILWLFRNARRGTRKVLAGTNKGQDAVPQAGVYFVTPDRSILIDARITLDELARDLKNGNDISTEEIRKRVLFAAARLNKIVPR